EFLFLYQTLIRQSPWKQFLAVRGVMTKLANLLIREIEELHRLEGTTLTSDLSQGSSLKMLTELLPTFLEQNNIKQQYKGRLVGAVLNGYLSLRRLVVQRTRLIDDTQEKLLELLEEMTSRTEKERLCSIIYPEKNDIGEFFLTPERDPQQEDFYKPGMGPLMNDVKNKICQDCELVALLEDDNGMKLLVNNKIISLRGDATEEFVETLNATTQQEVNNEEVYKMANVLADCGGLQVMLNCLSGIKDICRAKPLLQVLLKLFRSSVKVKKNQQVLIKPEIGVVTVLLQVLQPKITEQLLDIMKTILANATSQPLKYFEKISRTLGRPEHVNALLKCTQLSTVRQSNNVLIHLARVVTALTYGSSEKMTVLSDYFKPVLNFYEFDFKHTNKDEQKLKLFCTILTEGIKKNSIGNTLEVAKLIDEIFHDDTGCEEHKLSNYLKSLSSSSHQWLDNYYEVEEHLYVLNYTYNVIVDYTKNNEESINVSLDEKILKQCIKYWEQLIDTLIGCKALDEFFSSNTNRTLIS
ncbi:hypothetical protein HCN44_009080, partial [Aphidius gifuensis]